MSKTYRRASRVNARSAKIKVNDKVRDGKACGRKYDAGDYPKNGWEEYFHRRKSHKTKRVSSKARRRLWKGINI